MTSDRLMFMVQALIFFGIKIHHGRLFTKSPGKSYIHGKVNFVDMVDRDAFSVPELNSMMQDLGYVENHPMCYYFKAPDSYNMDVGIKPLGDDSDVRDLLLYSKIYKNLEVFVEEMENNVEQENISKQLPCKQAQNDPFDDPFFSELLQNDFGANIQTVNDGGEGNGANVHSNVSEILANDGGEGNGVNVHSNVSEILANDGGKGNGTKENEIKFMPCDSVTEGSDSGDESGNDSGEDSDFIVDDVVDKKDFEVDMTDFRNNIDDNVEWIGCGEKSSVVSDVPMEVETLNLDDFNNGTDSEDDPKRNEALRNLRREHNTNLNKKAHFHLGQTFGTKAEIKNLISLHVVEIRRNLHIIKDDRTRVRVICRGNIPIFSDSSQQMGRAHCDVLLNNICEVFNRQLVDAREKPIILALEYTRKYLMRRLVIVQKEIDKCVGPLTPNATALFDVIKSEASKYRATFNRVDKFQVVGPWLDQCVVNMTERSCSCRKWELTGMPCKHVACIFDMADNQQKVGIPESFVHPVYWLSTWKSMYEFNIGLVSGRNYWPKSDWPILVQPPKHHV